MSPTFVHCAHTTQQRVTYPDRWCELPTVQGVCVCVYEALPVNKTVMSGKCARESSAKLATRQINRLIGRGLWP